MRKPQAKYISRGKALIVAREMFGPMATVTGGIGRGTCSVLDGAGTKCGEGATWEGALREAREKK